MDSLIILIFFCLVFWVCWRWFLKEWVAGLSGAQKLKAHIHARQIPDEAYFEMAAEELERGSIRKGLWVQALVESDGQESAARVRYLKLRVKAMRDEAAHAIHRAVNPSAGSAAESTSEQFSNSAVVIPCVHCAGKLRLPSGRLLDVTCPHCGRGFRQQT